MSENLQRIREPLAWSMIGVLVLAIVFPVIQLVVYSGELVARDYAYWGLGMVATLLLPLLAMTAAVALCWVAPAPPRARPLTLVAAWLATVVVGLPVVALLGLSLTDPLVRLDVLPGTLDLVPDAVLGIVVVVALWVLAGPPPEVAEDPQDQTPAAESPPELEPAEPADPTAPAWRRDQAAAAAWRTADDAASGAPGTWEVTSPDEPDSPAPRR